MKPLNPPAQHPLPSIPAPADLAFVQVGGRHVVFNPDTLALWETDAETARLGKRASPSLADLPSRRPNLRLGNPNCTPQSLVLEVCQACNLGCRYCFVAHENPGGTVGRKMDLATARRAIDTLLPKRRDLRISFFGGEPLLNWPLVEQVVDYAEVLARERGGRASFGVTTNGTLIGPDAAAFLKAHRFSLIVSVDGPKWIHDRNRPFKGTVGATGMVASSHGHTLAGLEALRAIDYAGHVTLRGTYTPDCIHLAERLESLWSLRERGMGRNIDLEPACLSETACVSGSREFDIEQLRGQYESAADWFIARANAGDQPMFHPFTVRLRRLLHREAALSECGAGTGYLSVNAAGDIFACHRMSATRIGHLDYGIDEAARAPWLDNRVYQRSHCMKCPWRYVCGGGCRQDSMNLLGDIHTPTPLGCALTAIIVKQCIRIILEVGADTLIEFIPPRGGRKPCSSPGTATASCPRPSSGASAPRTPAR